MYAQQSHQHLSIHAQKFVLGKRKKKKWRSGGVSGVGGGCDEIGKNLKFELSEDKPSALYICQLTPHWQVVMIDWWVQVCATVITTVIATCFWHDSRSNIDNVFRSVCLTLFAWI